MELIRKSIKSELNHFEHIYEKALKLSSSISCYTYKVLMLIDRRFLFNKMNLIYDIVYSLHYFYFQGTGQDY